MCAIRGVQGHQLCRSRILSIHYTQSKPKCSHIGSTAVAGRSAVGLKATGAFLSSRGPRGGAQSTAQAAPHVASYYAYRYIDQRQRARGAAAGPLQAHRSVDLSEQQYKELDDKLSRLSQAEGWGVDALFALDASSTLVQYSFLTATDEDAVALVNELLQKRAAEREAAAAAAKRRRLDALPSSSAMAQPATWQDVQRQNRDDPLFMCFRPGGGGTPAAAALPVGLYAPELDEVAAMFAEAMHVDGDGDGDDPLSHEDCQVAFDLCVSMSRAFLDKGKREQAFRDILAPYLDQAIRMDGSISCYVDYGVDQLRVPVYLQVVKAEIGAQGDPYFEGQRRYQLHLLNEQLAPVVRHSVLPVLLLELVGPHLRVSALASPKDACVVCEPLTPYLHLFNMLSSQRSHMHCVARVLRALKRSIALLQDACVQLQLPTTAAEAAAPARLGAAGAATAAVGLPGGRDPHLQLPYPLRPGSAGFRDVEALWPGSDKLLYTATHVQSGRQMLVKFAVVSEHATRVHAAWAEAGLAPQLIESRQLPCGLTMIVMEFLSPEDGWKMFYSLAPERKQQLSDIILAKLEDAHAIDVGGGARAVHADMRQGNTMVRLRKDGSQQLVEPYQVRFLDFDWAGLEGQTRLRPFVRQRIGYGSGQEVTQQYDRDLWDHELETNGE